MFITEEVAKYLAGFFVDDMIATGQTVWTDDTEIINTVTMYDEAGGITAYTFELTQGYIVVSAYLDMPNLIMEWADEAEPVYEVFDLEEEDKIVYVDTLNYYLDEGEETLETVDGGEVPREEVENGFEEMRDIENVEEEVIEEIVEMKEEAPALPGGIATFANGYEGDFITDPFIYARNVHGGSWVVNNYANHWESHANFAIMAAFENNYQKCCGPVAITNLIKMYGNKYNETTIKNTGNGMVFNKVMEANTQYYNDVDGTYTHKADSFIKDSFQKYDISVRTYGTTADVGYPINYGNVVNAVGKNPDGTDSDYRLMYIMLDVNDYFEYANPYADDHSVVGYAYTRIRKTDFSRYESFIKIADGVSTSGRYLDIQLLGTDLDTNKNPKHTYWEVNFH